jgi:hypothetical protein
MKKLFSCFVLFMGISWVSSVSATELIPFAAVSGTGTYTGDLALLTNDFFPNEGAHWQLNTVWWQYQENTAIFNFDMGKLYNVEDMILSVDNNDSYRVDYSTDNNNWQMLFEISNTYGEIGWGMDTMGTSSNLAEYVYQIDFNPVTAQYLRIYATGGDHLYSVGEFQAFGTTPVPEPATLILFGSGLAGLAGLRRKGVKE